MAAAVQPLTDAAKDFLAIKYKDLTKWVISTGLRPISTVRKSLAQYSSENHS
jgi:hypothetical protein